MPLRRFIMRILASCGIKPFVMTKEYDDARCPHIRVAELVRGDGSKILTFTNPGWEARRVEAVVPDVATVAPFLCADVAVKFDGATAKFSLRPWQSIMLEAK